MLKDTLRMSSASLKALDLKTSLICTGAGRALHEESLALTIPIVEKLGSSASLKVLDLKTSLICTDVGRALQEVLEEESLALTIPIVEKPGTSLWKVKYCAAEWEAQAQIKVRLIRSVSLTLRPLAYAYH